MVYDLEHKYTLDSLHEWIDTVEYCVGSDSVLVWALFGNKSDLDRTVWEIEESDLRSFDSKAHLFFNVSAKTGDNILQAFGEVVERLDATTTATLEVPRRRAGERSVRLDGTNKRNRISC